MTAQRVGKAYLEESAEADFVRRVRLLGGRSIKVVPITAGWPDRLVLLPGGGMYLVEMKQDNTDLSPIQQVVHSRLRAMGHNVVVLHGKDEAKAWLAARIDALGPQSRRPGRPKQS